MQTVITLWRFHDIIRPIEGHGSCTVCRDKQLAGQPVQYTWKGKKSYFFNFSICFPSNHSKYNLFIIFFISLTSTSGSKSILILVQTISCSMPNWLMYRLFLEGCIAFFKKRGRRNEITQTYWNKHVLKT